MLDKEEFKISPHTKRPILQYSTPESSKAYGLCPGLQITLAIGEWYHLHQLLNHKTHSCYLHDSQIPQEYQQWKLEKDPMVRSSLNLLQSQKTCQLSHYQLNHKRTFTHNPHSHRNHFCLNEKTYHLQSKKIGYSSWCSSRIGRAAWQTRYQDLR